MTEYVQKSGLQVAAELADFAENTLLPGTGVAPADFWAGLADLVARFGPKNAAALKTRDDLQAAIDKWHVAHRNAPFDAAAYRAFLEQIGYLKPEGPDFSIDTANVDPEIALVSGPQLVVPVMNARFALNAANARWGSLYDALYGSTRWAACLRARAMTPRVAGKSSPGRRISWIRRCRWRAPAMPM